MTELEALLESQDYAIAEVEWKLECCSSKREHLIIEKHLSRLHRTRSLLYTLHCHLKDPT